MRRHAKASSAGSSKRRVKGRSGLKALGPALSLLLLLALLAPVLAAAENGDYVESFGPDGTSGTEFELPATLAVDPGTGAVYVGDSTSQTLYKFDASGTPLDWGGAEGYIAENRITGLSIDGAVLGRAQVAADPDSHVVYLTSANKVRAFEANGEPHEFTALGAGVSELSGATKLTGVAVDRFGNLYASDSEDQKIRIYRPSGELITEFAPVGSGGSAIAPGNLAIADDGTLYATATTFRSAYAFEPSRFPVTAETTYGLGQPLNDQSSESVVVDPSTQHVYIGELCPEGECEFAHENSAAWRVSVYDDEGNLVDRIGTAEPGALRGSVSGVGVSDGSKRLYAAVSGELGGLSQVSVFETFTFPVIAPSVTATSVIDLNLHTATLRARVNPNTLETTYHFEYGLEDCKVSACTSIGGGTIVSGHKPVAVTPQEITGLQPGTTYHYRVVAKNSKGETKGPDRTFITPRAGLGFSLADSRAWEMVSPPNKSGGRILHYNQGVMQAAADGNGLALQTVTSIEADPEGTRAIDSSTVLARRSAAGPWSSKDVTPPQTEITPLRFGGVYKLFSTDLRSALLEPQDGTPLSPEASEETPYLRDNTEPGTYRPLVTAKEGYANVPEGTVFGGHASSARSPVAVRAANGDLTHVVLKSREPLMAGAEPESLYEWSEGQLRAVSLAGETIAAEAGSGFRSVQHAISEDGTRIFWQAGKSATGLYVRDTESEETDRLDIPEEGVGLEGASDPIFQAASADGSVVFFADTQRLSADASAAGLGARDLYRCEVGTLEGGGLGCTSLTDISAPLEGSGEKAEVLGIAPAFSEDGTRAYFFARGVLDTEPNQAGESAVAGEPNLYLWEEGEGRRFIATLSKGDRGDWGLIPADAPAQTSKLSAAASPDGRYLAFMSERSLSGYDNRDAKSDEAVEEVFRYDAVADELDCVSCNPSGASPEGVIVNPTGGSPPEVEPQSVWAGRWVGAILPTAQESEPTTGLTFRRPRVVHDNGRVFFNAIDPLVSADANGEWDVYQYEPSGTGDCTASSEGAAIARSAGGCVSLLSSGTAEEEASFIDASEGGDDVFFITPARLSVTDEDEELDIYDARVDGVPATLSVINECLGEACQPPPNPPNDPTPASASFRGAGNVASERCPASKRRVMRDGHPRCVAKKHKKKRSHKAKSAASNRRAGR